jgi:cation:H+ antiporter
MDALTLALFVAGFVLLILGADWLVRGASRIAAALGVTPLIIGLTVVAYGTSAPELAVGIKSAWSGQSDLALGNAVGSNVFNVLFILGVSATVAPLVVSSQLVRLDVPILIVVSTLTFGLAADGAIGRGDAVLLTSLAIAYTVFQVRQSRGEAGFGRLDDNEAEVPARRTGVTNLGLIAAGLLLLVVGSRWLVAGAVSLAQTLGVSELVIGLTIVAAGTGLPEVATSIVAAARGERDIAVGNVIGSNYFNLTMVLGVCGLLSPGGLPAAAALVRFDLPVMVAVAVACLPVFASGREISRWEGVLFLVYYGAYAGYLVLDAQEHDALPAFSAAMGLFVLPLTAVTLAIVSWRTWHDPARRR